jgi:hypothetical protein
MESTTAKTVIALYQFESEAEHAAADLVSEGFSREQIDIISGHELSRPEQHVTATEDKEGKVFGAVGKGFTYGGGLGAVAGGISSLLVPGVGPLVIAGAFAAALLGAGLGASVGGVMAALMQAGVDESDARLFEAALRHGGVVLVVNTDEAHARQAVTILDRNGALDMDEHRVSPDDRGADEVEGSANNRVADTARNS